MFVLNFPETVLRKNWKRIKSVVNISTARVSFGVFLGAATNNMKYIPAGRTITYAKKRRITLKIVSIFLSHFLWHNAKFTCWEPSANLPTKNVES
jgi:hypothetical protein